MRGQRAQRSLTKTKENLWLGVVEETCIFTSGEGGRERKEEKGRESGRRRKRERRRRKEREKEEEEERERELKRRRKGEKKSKETLMACMLPLQ